MARTTTDGGKTEMGAHQKLAAAGELLDRPDDGILLRGIPRSADARLELWRVGILGDRDDDLYVVCRGAALELALGLCARASMH